MRGSKAGVIRLSLRTVAADEPGGEAAIRSRFRDEGLAPRSWSSDPGFRFGRHSHPRDKVLYCVRGSIVFLAGDIQSSVGPGDRLEIEAGTDHAATVGPEGVDCLEAYR